jgi:hypothetical protein
MIKRVVVLLIITLLILLLLNHLKTKNEPIDVILHVTTTKSGREITIAYNKEGKAIQYEKDNPKYNVLEVVFEKEKK